jgi:hypothetical protein
MPTVTERSTNPPLQPSNLPGGISTAMKGKPLGNWAYPDPIKWHSYWNDFDTYAAGDWTVTETQGSATQATVSGNGGLLALVNSGTENDINAIRGQTAFIPDPAKGAVFVCRFKVSNATESDVIVGLVDTFTGFDPAEGLYFVKADGSTSVSLVLEKASTTTTLAAVATMANDTFIELAWVYTGTRVEVYVNGNLVAAQTTLTNLPTAVTGVGMGVANGDGNPRTLTVDYVLASVER